jgi:uncharacterized membrane protein
MFAPKKDKAKIIIGCGGAMVALGLIEFIWTLVVYGSAVGFSEIVGVLIGMVLPVLYIAGGLKRKNAPY